MNQTEKAHGTRMPAHVLGIALGLCLAIAAAPSSAFAQDTENDMLSSAEEQTPMVAPAGDEVTPADNTNVIVQSDTPADPTVPSVTPSNVDVSESVPNTTVDTDAPVPVTAEEPATNPGDSSGSSDDAVAGENDAPDGAVGEGNDPNNPDDPNNQDDPNNPQDPENPIEEDPEPEVELPTHNFAFETGLSYGVVVDVKGGKSDNKTNIQMYRSNDSKAQRWYLEAYGNGYYIVSVLTGKVLDVAGGKAAKGTNVWLYNKNGSNAQLWLPELTDTGGWVIRSLLNTNYVLDVAGGKTTNGTNLQIWSYNGSKAQTFYFREVNPPLGTGDRILSDGTYAITTSKDQNKVLDVASGSTTKGANIQLYKSNGTIAQRFYLTYSNGYYTLQSMASGLALEVASGSPVARANVRLWTPNHTPAQQWLITQTDNGMYQLVNRGTGLVLEIAGGKTDNKTNVWGYYGNDTASQKWSIDAAPVVSNGFYTIVDNQTGKVFDVTSGSLSNGAKIQRYKGNGTIAQKFYIEFDPDTQTYNLRSVNSASYLTSSDGANIIQSKASGLDRNWKLVWNGSGLTLMLGNHALHFDSNNKATLGSLQGSATIKPVTTSLFKQGYYQFKSLVGTFLDVEGQSKTTANCVTNSDTSTSSQVWRIWATGGAYAIINEKSGMALDLAYSSNSDGVRVRQSAFTGAKTQLWKIVWNEVNGGLSIINVKSGKALDVKNASTSTGAVVNQNSSGSSKGQSWRLTDKTLVALREHIAQVSEHFASDNNHGYSQPNRGLGPKETVTLLDFTTATISGWDVDCSELVRQCINVIFSPDDQIEFLSTRNEDSVLLASGFQRIKFSPSAVQRGDILWMSGHTGVALGDGKQAEAAVDENNSIYGPKRGDQTGKEVAVNRLGTYWTYIYRYVG